MAPEPRLLELVEYIVRNIVDEPDSVRVVEEEGRRLTVFQVTVAESDRGKVIGRAGRIANAIRTVVKAAASLERRNVAVEIVT